MEFNPNMINLNDLANISPIANQAMGVYGAGLPDGMKQGLMSQMPMGMMNRDGQAFMGQQQPQQQMPQQPPQGNPNADAMKVLGQGMQNMGRGMQMQMPSANTAQIMHDPNQFRFAGNQQQQMAQALRRR